MNQMDIVEGDMFQIEMIIKLYLVILIDNITFFNCWIHCRHPLYLVSSWMIDIGTEIKR